jgi:hypothetical protein
VTIRLMTGLGTFETSIDVRYTAALGGKADTVTRPIFSKHPGGPGIFSEGGQLPSAGAVELC